MSQSWRDHHTMAALTLPEMVVMLEAAGFEVTLLEHDYHRMALWDQESFNAIVVARKPS